MCKFDHALPSKDQICRLILNLDLRHLLPFESSGEDEAQGREGGTPDKHGGQSNLQQS